MKLTKIEGFIIVLTLAFLCFLGGFFLGKNQNRSALIVSTQTNSVDTTSAPESTEVEQVQTSASADPAPVESTNAEPESGGALEKIQPGDALVNINTANLETLMTLPRIGETLAQRIIDYRTQYGPFLSPESLTDVYGIGESTLEKLLPYITVE